MMLNPSMNDQKQSMNDVDSSIRVLKMGKACGYDGITAEHIIYSHPLIVLLLSILFNAIVRYAYVPDSFAKGVIIPILKNNELDDTTIENYRGITLSCVVSKLFEKCIMGMFKDYLYSSELQFGFKGDVGCSDAIFTMRTAIDYLTERGSTATVCALDLFKAFDKVDTSILFLKLMKRQMPRCFIALLASWYKKCSAVVRWDNWLSEPFVVKAGVRQGGVLSPALFAIYMDDMIQNCMKQVMAASSVTSF